MSPVDAGGLAAARSVRHCSAERVNAEERVSVAAGMVATEKSAQSSIRAMLTDPAHCIFLIITPFSSFFFAIIDAIIFCIFIIFSFYFLFSFIQLSSDRNTYIAENTNPAKRDGDFAFGISFVHGFSIRMERSRQ